MRVPAYRHETGRGSTRTNTDMIREYPRPIMSLLVANVDVAAL